MGKISLRSNENKMKIFKRMTIIVLCALIMLIPVFQGSVVPVCGESGGIIKGFQQNEYVDAGIIKINDDGTITYNVDPESGSYLGCAGAIITVTVLE